jgi:hypothetical protein
VSERENVQIIGKRSTPTSEGEKFMISVGKSLKIVI